MCQRATGPGGGQPKGSDGGVHDRARLVQDPAQVLLAAEGLRVELGHVLGAGRARGEPALVRGDLDAADRGVVAGGAGQDGRYRFPGQSPSRSPARARGFLVRIAFPAGATPGRRCAGRRGRRTWRSGLRYPTTEGSCPRRAVSSAASRQAMMPSLSVVQTVPSRRRNEAPALAAEAERAVHEACHEPLEPDGNLDQPPAEARRDAVDDRGGDERLADGDVGAPRTPAAEQVVDRRGDDVVGVHQPDAAGRRSRAGPRRRRCPWRGRTGRAAPRGGPSRTARTGPCGSCRPSRGS